MKSITDRLPPGIAVHVHPDRRKNEAGYWAARDQIRGQYEGQWIGFADGKIVASGTSPVAVFHAAEQSGLHPFLTCVGREDEPCRMRRFSSPYDSGYPGEALPILSVEFRRKSRTPGILFDRVYHRHGRRCERLALGRLSTTAIRPFRWPARFNGWRWGEYCTDFVFPPVGHVGWS